MIIVRAPFRVSFLGGGSDAPSYFLDSPRGGAVIGAALNKYCYLSVRQLPRYFDYSFRAVYSKIELADHPADVEHPTIRAALTQAGFDENNGLEIHHFSDLPARSGTGSSSSFVVALLHALAALRGELIEKRALADAAIHLERVVAAEPGGWQDQCWAALGGLQRLDFRPDGTWSATPIILPPGRREELCASLLLVFSGLARDARVLGAEKQARAADNRPYLDALVALVDDAQALLCDRARPAHELGNLLTEAHRLKAATAPGVATEEVDAILATARSAGATGGKVMGEGGGGFALVAVAPDARPRVEAALRELRINGKPPVIVPFGIDAEGSKVCLYEPNGIGS